MPGQGPTRIADILVPEVWVPYTIEKAVKKNALVQSGIISPDPRLAVLASNGRGGQEIDMPFFQQLSGDEEVITSGTGATNSETTPDNLTTSKDIAVLWGRVKTWASEDWVATLAGSDPLDALATMVNDYTNQQEQQLLIKILKGVFKDNVNDSSDLIYSAYTEDGNNATESNKMNADNLIDAATKLGDAAGKLTAIMVHSAVYAKMRKDNLIDFVQISEQDSRVPYFMEYRVIVDDDCPKTSGTTTGSWYKSYLFGAGAIGRADGQIKYPVETQRVIRSKTGLEEITYRRVFVLHPRGIKWTGSSKAADSPSNTEASYGCNWDRVYDKKNIAIVELRTN